MKQIDYSTILQQRSLLPRREHLFRAIRTKQAALIELEKSYREKRLELQQEILELKLAKDSYSFSQDELELISRADTVVREENIQGIYQILINGEPRYVGEAQCVRTRLRNHAAAILRGSSAHEMYALMSEYEPSEIDFCILEHAVKPATFKGNDKQWRVLREAFHGYKCIEEGFQLYNKGFQVSKETVDSYFR